LKISQKVFSADFSHDAFFSQKISNLIAFYRKMLNKITAVMSFVCNA